MSMLKNILAVLLGIVVGSLVNMGLIMVSGSIIPPPAGADATTMEGLQASMHLFEFKHFIFPFLAHALGTLAGAAVVTMLAVSHQLRYAISIGVVFLAGGISNVVLLPSPLWFNVVDLVGAYLPMAWLGWWLVCRVRGGKVQDEKSLA